MNLSISENKNVAGQQAAARAAGLIRQVIGERGEANIIVATGASQFEMMDHLVQATDLPWSKVTAFHLDEYVGLPETHPASFRRYLKERFVQRLPEPLKAMHFISGEGDCQAECARLNRLISGHPIDLAFVGIGENGHLAFNDPPADFETTDPYLVVNLDEACRRQQMGEGWFMSLDEVPMQAISMSVLHILKSRVVIATVPDARKAEAVKNSLEGPITPMVPSSILQQHDHVDVFLDRASASLLKEPQVVT